MPVSYTHLDVYKRQMLNLDLLNISKKEREQIDEVISHPRGMLLMVGPTGSGKSTTLYSILNALNTPDRKIITLEDPVENTIPGIAQIPIDTTNGQRFADGLRSVLPVSYTHLDVYKRQV